MWRKLVLVHSRSLHGVRIVDCKSANDHRLYLTKENANDFLIRSSYLTFNNIGVNLIGSAK